MQPRSDEAHVAKVLASSALALTREEVGVNVDLGIPLDDSPSSDVVENLASEPVESVASGHPTSDSHNLDHSEILDVESPPKVDLFNEEYLLGFVPIWPPQ